MTLNRLLGLGAGLALLMGLSQLVLPAASSSGGERKKFTNSLGMEFVLIPAGKFMMGSLPSETDGDTDETRHQVTISRPFYMQTTEVTQGQWRALMGNNPSKFKDCGDDCPVESVSFNEILDFISRLNDKEGGAEYRLPTEAEWEYAARAGNTGAYCFGNDTDKLDEYAWYSNNSGGRTHPVGRKRPNAWGLYDMHGNVWEWCRDRYGNYPSKPVTDPQGPSRGAFRQDRGGGWDSWAYILRSAFRSGQETATRYNFLGFRLARTS
ncbi:MAG: formylglycine-generating enzyme family protein [Deltaproteobacteria bacterium]|nr:formylglycine-generating enzyme family protein [Deltaproteobacteria bacterium]